MRILVAAWFTLEALASINRIARVLPMLGIYSGSVWLIVAARAALTALQMATVWTLVRKLPPAIALLRVTLLGSAALLTLELGLALAPTSVFPGHRWPIVIAYWAITFTVLAWTYWRRARPFQ